MSYLIEKVEEHEYEFLALDVETGGLDPRKHSLLSIGAVLFSLKHRHVEKIEIFGPSDRNLVISPGAYFMHQSTDLLCKVFDEGLDALFTKHQQRSHRPVSALLTWIQGKAAFDRKLTVVGKNPSFDMAFLKQDARKCDMYTESLLTQTFSHRLFDIGSYCFDPNLDDSIPGLDELIERYGVTVPLKVRHTALADAEALIPIMRHRYYEQTGVGDIPN